MQTPVVVGLSGGIDSFVTALLLQREGYEVIGVHLSLWGDDDNRELFSLCNQLNIELIDYDGRDFFDKKVVQPFINEYISGRTPSPCALCNNEVKWELLRKIADERGVEKIACGHYVRIYSDNGLYYIQQGVDPVKDQSYFLWGLNQSILSRAITPLGTYTKEEVRKMAADSGYSGLVKKKESMGVCFLAGKDYRQFILEYTGRTDLQKSGDIVDPLGNIIAKHTGLLNYTIGQKRGIPLHEERQLYVSSIDFQNNIIVVDEKSSLQCTSFLVKDYNLTDISDLHADDIRVAVRGLGLNPEGFSQLKQVDAKTLSVTLSSPAWAVAPGQPVVFYKHDLVMGGGVVK
ncbi:tRNA 2-thiouridine(34) synthase MnmA [Odoribacter sp. OttesenSCG-928-J03]|nr:tRNA 2-thiouridine(34) synthase MnmA [Odoribacter sp. OttesenSCG-928-J03]MDL2282921.1 tRNA 2-thiouridine(34) synthase MnmA [Odoribacter sp. OttesenSCG-928-G04]MDL2330887.1 tRNA 2-thiouridine(34) synthase MnmA [Odoribacter sp. OttesenSCG-928-A06]